MTTNTTPQYTLFIPLLHSGGFYFPLTKAQSARVELKKHEGISYALVQDGYFMPSKSGKVSFKKAKVAPISAFYVVRDNLLIPGRDDPLLYGEDLDLAYCLSKLAEWQPTITEWLTEITPLTGEEAVKRWQVLNDYTPPIKYEIDERLNNPQLSFVTKSGKALVTTTQKQRLSQVCSYYPDVFMHSTAKLEYKEGKRSALTVGLARGEEYSLYLLYKNSLFPCGAQGRPLNEVLTKGFTPENIITMQGHADEWLKAI